MSSIATSSVFDAQGFEEFLQRRVEPRWLTDLRRDAWQHAQQMDWPAKKHEEWIRTDLRLFNLAKHTVPDGVPPVIRRSAGLA